MKQLLVLMLCLWAATEVRSFGGADDRYIKKYAMMKVYESCFGPDVVKEIRQEMKAACAKCAGVSPTAPAQAVPPPAPAPATMNPAADRRKPLPPQAFDATRLQQAILGFRTPVQNPLLQSYLQHPQQQLPLMPQYRPQLQSSSAAYYPQQYPAYYPGAASYSSQPYYPVPNPYYQQPYYPVAPSSNAGYSSTQRMSRDLDIRGQLETLTSRLSGKIRNVTCVMQELGYLDENLEPNFEKISERINRLPIGEELKRDMVDGVQFCKQFAQCVPETRKDKFQLSRELVKPMFFFRCYKHKKLEACIMKDVRERYSSAEDMGAEEDASELRSLTWSKPDYDDMATAVYEFLYGGENSELENIM